jgi:hypothetical protein
MNLGGKDGFKISDILWCFRAIGRQAVYRHGESYIVLSNRLKAESVFRQKTLIVPFIYYITPLTLQVPRDRCRGRGREP